MGSDKNRDKMPAFYFLTDRAVGVSNEHDKITVHDGAGVVWRISEQPLAGKRAREEQSAPTSAPDTRQDQYVSQQET